MKWVTRKNVKVDRVACPWLIRKFIDPHAEFLFVPPMRYSPSLSEKKQFLTTCLASSSGITAKNARLKPLSRSTTSRAIQRSCS